MVTHLPFIGIFLAGSNAVVSLPTFREHFANMVKLMKLKQNPWWNFEIGEIKSNQLVRPACSQVASARPKWKQTAKDTREKIRETHWIIVHKFTIRRGVRHGQVVQLLSGQGMRDLRIWCTAGGMHDVEAKAFNIFHEANAVPSHLVAQFQHERCILSKG